MTGTGSYGQPDKRRVLRTQVWSWGLQLRLAAERTKDRDGEKRRWICRRASSDGQQLTRRWLDPMESGSGVSGKRRDRQQADWVTRVWVPRLGRVNDVHNEDKTFERGWPQLARQAESLETVWAGRCLCPGGHKGQSDIGDAALPRWDRTKPTRSSSDYGMVLPGGCLRELAATGATLPESGPDCGPKGFAPAAPSTGSAFRLAGRVASSTRRNRNVQAAQIRDRQRASRHVPPCGSVRTLPMWRLDFVSELAAVQAMLAGQRRLAPRRRSRSPFVITGQSASALQQPSVALLTERLRRPLCRAVRKAQPDERSAHRLAGR